MKKPDPQAAQVEFKLDKMAGAVQEVQVVEVPEQVKQLELHA